MSNELTPQEKYRKFYEDPHLWIGAPMQLQCIEKHWELKDDPRSEVSLGALYLYDAEMYNSIWLFGTVDKYLPLFKPQEGEAFIKDLEQAVSAGVGTQARRIIKSPKNIIAFDAEHQFYQCIMIIENDIKKVTSMLTDFDTAAYVDTLRKLGYYL